MDGELRRILIGQYDEMDEPEALDAIVADFVEVGFVASERPAPYDAVLREPGAGRADVVRVTVEQLPGIEEDTLVRGHVRARPARRRGPVRRARVCSDPRSTKRWDDE